MDSAAQVASDDNLELSVDTMVSAATGNQVQVSLMLKNTSGKPITKITLSVMDSMNVKVCMHHRNDATHNSTTVCRRFLTLLCAVTVGTMHCNGPLNVSDVSLYAILYD